MSCSESSQTEADPLPPYRFRLGCAALLPSLGRFPSCLSRFLSRFSDSPARSAAFTLWTCQKGIEQADRFTLHRPGAAAKHGNRDGREGGEASSGGLLGVAWMRRGGNAFNPDYFGQLYRPPCPQPARPLPTACTLGQLRPQAALGTLGHPLHLGRCPA